MDNQHRKIKGYKELNQDEIDLMNQIKEQGLALEQLIERMQANPLVVLDQRWVQEGVIGLQKSLMYLTRSVAKPDFF